MKKRNALIFMASAIILSACGSSNTRSLVSSTPSATQLPPTVAATITPTSTPSPTPTPLPFSSENIANISEDFQIGVGDISDVSWLPDGNIAFTHSAGVSIYDPNTLELVKTNRPINKVALSDSVVSHNGKYGASLVDNQKIQIWDINSGEVIHEIDTKCVQTPSQTNRLAFSSFDTQIFGCDGNDISLWDLRDLNKITTFASLNAPERIIVNSDGGFLAVGSTCDISVWDTASGKTVGKFSNQCGNPVMAFSHDGSMLAVTAEGNTEVSIYEISSKKTLKMITNNGGIMALDFSNDDKTIAMGSFYFQGTSFADVATGESTSKIPNTPARIIRFSPDGSRILLGWQSFSVWTADDTNHQKLGNTGNFDKYNQIVTDHNSRYIAVGGDSVSVALWDLQQKAALPSVSAYGGEFAFDPTGNYLLTRSWKNNWWGGIELWNLQYKSSTPFDDIIEKTPDTAMWPVYSPSNDLVAVGFEHSQIKLWDTSSYKLSITLNQGNLTDYKFSPDGTIFASSGSRTIDFWDIATQKISRQITAGGSISNISFSPDGNLIAAATNNGVFVYNTATGLSANRFTEIKNAKKVIFNPQGNIIGALGYDPNNKISIFVWNIEGNTFMYKIPSEINQYQGTFLFSPDGSVLVTNALGEYLQFWNATSGNLIKTIDWFKTSNPIDKKFTMDTPTSNFENSIAFTPDGRELAAAAADGIVEILKILP